MDQIANLITLLSREALVFEQFLVLLKEQRRLLVANDLTGLQLCTEQQREKLVEAQLLHKERDEVLAHLRSETAWDGDLTVQRLIELADNDQANQMRRLRESILALNDQILTARTTNALLIDHSRQFIARTMTMLATIDKPATSYQPHQDTNNGSGQLLLDRRG